ncbi:MAG: putative bifunctional diguanylate cyclase/phosphodiesterase [Ilumatobacter sp.]
MFAHRRLGGFPLAVYVAALLMIPLTAVGVFSVREVDRNNAAASNSQIVSTAASIHVAALDSVGSTSIERAAMLALVDDPQGQDAQRIWLTLESARADAEVALDRLELELSEDERGGALFLQVVRQARGVVEAERIALDRGTATAASIVTSFAVLEDQIENIVERTVSTLESIDSAPAEVLQWTRGLILTGNLVLTAVTELDAVSLSASDSTAITPAQRVGDDVRHSDALGAALPLDPVAVSNLRADHSGIRSTAASGEVSDRIEYVEDLDRFVSSTGDRLSGEIEAWAGAAQNKNRSTLLMLGIVGIASMLFGLIVMRSFTSPLTRLRLQAERVSRGELNAELLPVEGPSDVRKVTGAINDMAGTLSLVENHMDALAQAEMETAPALQELPGHVGAAMRTSVERVVALTTRLKMSESRLAEQARIDNLTGLPNRFAVLEYLEETLASHLAGDSAHSIERSTGVMFLDVDGFKSVNDMHGHAVGDVVLREIAQRLSRSVRDVDYVARLGGDEFLVVVADVSDASRLVAFGERMIEQIEQPYNIGDQLFAVSASVGITVIEAGDDSMSVIERSDAAVYQAKNRGRRRVEIFDKELQRSIEHQADLELALRQAIQHGELMMFLQPMADLSTGQPCGAEALVRWNRPGVGLVPPSEFIPIAERSGLIFELERWMLEAACRRIAEWKLMGKGAGMRLAVNISGRHLIEGSLIADIDNALAATGADPNLLEIELTESQLLDDVPRASAVLAEVRRRGVKVAIDDFGTGYSSMTYLQKLPVDVVKIDQSFIASATTNSFDSTIVDTIVTIGKALDLEIVAEGIETVAQLAYVIDAGVTHGQGFLMARPMPAHDAEAVIFGEALFNRDRVLESTREIPRPRHRAPTS